MGHNLLSVSIVRFENTFLNYKTPEILFSGLDNSIFDPDLLQCLQPENRKKARKSRGLEMLSDIEKLGIMLGEKPFNARERERDESPNSNLSRRPESFINDEFENDEEGTRRNQRVTNPVTGAELDRNSVTANSSVEINRLSRELNSRISQEMEEMINSVSVQIQRAINDAINNQVLPQIQNVIMAGSGHVTKKGWNVPAERPEPYPEVQRNLDTRNNLRNEQDEGNQNGDLPRHNVYDMVTVVGNGQLETPKSTIELKFEVGDIEFHEIFIVMENLTGPIIGLMFLQRNHTVLDMRQEILNFPFFSMQLKTADHRYSNVLEPIINPIEVTNPPNDRVLIRSNSLFYPENAVTGILQPSDLLHDEGDITFCPALVSLNDGSITIPVNNFTDHPYNFKKGLHIANFLVITPEQMKYVKPVDPASTWHFLQNDQEQEAHYVSSLIKTNKNPQNSENFWFPTPENPGNPAEHTPIQKRILRELQALQDLETLDPTEDEESRAKFLENFDWKDSTLSSDEKRKIEELLVDFHNIFARYRFDIGMNEEFKVKLTPRDNSPAYSQSLPALIIVKEDILVELAMLHKYGIITHYRFQNMPAQYLPKRNQTGNSDSWLT